MRYLSCSICLLILLTLNMLAQVKTCDQSTGYVIDKEKPSVYIEFEQFGKADDWQSSRLGEVSKKAEIKKGNDVWLRLYNNSCWDIQVKTLSGSLHFEPDPANRVKKKLAFDILDGAAINVVYTSEEQDGKVVPGGGDSFSESFLPSGRSLVFPVYKMHLEKSRSIYVAYNYGWEKKIFSNNLAPDHHSFFWGYRLKEEKKK